MEKKSISKNRLLGTGNVWKLLLPLKMLQSTERKKDQTFVPAIFIVFISNLNKLHINGRMHLQKGAVLNFVSCNGCVSFCAVKDSLKHTV